MLQKKREKNDKVWLSHKCFQVIVLKEGELNYWDLNFKKKFLHQRTTLALITFIKTSQHFNFVSCLGIVLLLKVWQLTSNHNKIDYKVILSNLNIQDVFSSQYFSPWMDILYMSKICPNIQQAIFISFKVIKAGISHTSTLW